MHLTNHILNKDSPIPAETPQNQQSSNADATTKAVAIHAIEQTHENPEILDPQRSQTINAMKDVDSTHHTNVLTQAKLLFTSGMSEFHKYRIVDVLKSVDQNRLEEFVKQTRLLITSDMESFTISQIVKLMKSVDQNYLEEFATQARRITTDMSGSQKFDIYNTLKGIASTELEKFATQALRITTNMSVYDKFGIYKYLTNIISKDLENFVNNALKLIPVDMNGHDKSNKVQHMIRAYINSPKETVDSAAIQHSFDADCLAPLYPSGHDKK